MSFSFGPFILKQSVDEQILDIFENASRKLKLDHSENLAGQIEKELLFTEHDDFEKMLMPYFENYIKEANKNFLIKMRNKLTLKSLWTNFQYKGEYNPIHTHTNCDLSFVLYIKVPQNIYEFQSFSKTTHGAVTFHYGERNFLCKNKLNFQPQRGDLVIFPSWTQHSVEGFKKDEERISVAGNLDIIDETLYKGIQNV
tara:strand:+ start:312 stop:905 length:594 start_codon:yes stop_codon:yes gene_type:complete